MVPSSGWDGTPGDRVLTTLGGLGARPSLVVWVEEGLAGIAFDEPLHSAVYDLLRAQLDGTWVDPAGEAARREQTEAARRPQGPRSLA